MFKRDDYLSKKCMCFIFMCNLIFNLETTHLMARVWDKGTTVNEYSVSCTLQCESFFFVNGLTNVDLWKSVDKKQTTPKGTAAESASSGHHGNQPKVINHSFCSAGDSLWTTNYLCTFFLILNPVFETLLKFDFQLFFFLKWYYNVENEDKRQQLFSCENSDDKCRTG